MYHIAEMLPHPLLFSLTLGQNIVMAKKYIIHTIHINLHTQINYTYRNKIHLVIYILWSYTIQSLSCKTRLIAGLYGCSAVTQQLMYFSTGGKQLTNQKFYMRFKLYQKLYRKFQKRNYQAKPVVIFSSLFSHKICHHIFIFFHDSDHIQTAVTNLLRLLLALISCFYQHNLL